MHNVLFSMKRAFHRSYALSTALLAEHDLTPARFDLLFAIRANGIYGAMQQSDLRRLLGVAPQTVSKMVAALRRLGLLTSERRGWGADRRQRLLRLTREAIRRVRAVLESLVRTGRVHASVASFAPPEAALATSSATGAPAASRFAASAPSASDPLAFERALTHVRRRLTDRARLDLACFVPDDDDEVALYAAA